MAGGFSSLAVSHAHSGVCFCVLFCFSLLLLRESHSGTGESMAVMSVDTELGEMMGGMGWNKEVETHRDLGRLSSYHLTTMFFNI